MTKQLRWTWGAVLMMSLGAAVACSAATNPWTRVPSKDHERANPLAGKQEAVAAGAVLYRDHCEQCHKADARGDGRKKPSLRGPDVQKATDGDLEWFLRQGDLGRGMPSWSNLPPAQRWEIITYLRSLQ